MTVIRAVRKLRLSRVARRPQRVRDGLVAADAAGDARRRARSARRVCSAPALLTAPLPAGPADATPLDAPRARRAAGRHLRVRAARADRRSASRCCAPRSELDRRPPAARLVRFRVRGRAAFLVVRLPEAATVRVLAGARVVVRATLARAPASTASASACRQASPRACGSSSSTRRATPARAGPFASRAQPESELIVSSGTISRIGASRASSAAVGELLEARAIARAVHDQAVHREIARAAPPRA